MRPEWPGSRASHLKRRPAEAHPPGERIFHNDPHGDLGALPIFADPPSYQLKSRCPVGTHEVKPALLTRPVGPARAYQNQIGEPLQHRPSASLNGSPTGPPLQATRDAQRRPPHPREERKDGHREIRRRSQRTPRPISTAQPHCNRRASGSLTMRHSPHPPMVTPPALLPMHRSFY